MEVLHHIAAAKGAEYLIAMFGLFSYIAFWRLINGPQTQSLTVSAMATRLTDLIAGFVVPRDVMYHPGHAWARLGDDGLVTVGMDDFAGKLLGKVDDVYLPDLGQEIKQGEVAWLIAADNKNVKMLAPVGGKVVAVNEQIYKDPKAATSDPYRTGWLLKVKASNPTANLKNLIPADMVGGWFENIRDSLGARRMAPALATMYQDGGFPVDGIAKVLDAEKWDKIAGEYFLTEE